MCLWVLQTHALSRADTHSWLTAKCPGRTHALGLAHHVPSHSKARNCAEDFRPRGTHAGGRFCPLQNRSERSDRSDAQSSASCASRSLEASTQANPRTCENASLRSLAWVFVTNLAGSTWQGMWGFPAFAACVLFARSALDRCAALWCLI